MNDLGSRPTQEYLNRFSELCELANGIIHLVDQYRQADAAAAQWYEIAKDRKRQIDELRARLEHQGAAPSREGLNTRDLAP